MLEASGRAALAVLLQLGRAAEGDDLADLVPTARGDLVDVLSAALAGVPVDALICQVDTCVHVFLPTDLSTARVG